MTKYSDEFKIEAVQMVLKGNTVESVTRTEYPLKKLLEYTGMAKSTCYAVMKSINQGDKYSELKEAIKRICIDNKGRYGYRRVTLELRRKGFKVNHKVVMRLMKQTSLTCKVRLKKYKSCKGKRRKAAPNILQRNFKADKPNEKWATDITEFALFRKKLYLSPIIDLYNGEIISYKVSEHPVLKQVTDMVKKQLGV